MVSLMIIPELLASHHFVASSTKWTSICWQHLWMSPFRRKCAQNLDSARIAISPERPNSTHLRSFRHFLKTSMHQIGGGIIPVDKLYKRLCCSMLQAIFTAT